MTPSLHDWIQHELYPIEESSFRLWRRVMPLVMICERVRRGVLPRHAADASIRDYNRRNQTSYTFDEIVSRSLDTYEMADFNEWGAYTLLEDQESVLFGLSDNVAKNMARAPADVKWGIMYRPESSVVVLYRSPYVQRRLAFLDPYGDLITSEEEELCMADGLDHDGDLRTTVLPPDIEAAVKHDHRRGR